MLQINFYPFCILDHVVLSLESFHRFDFKKKVPKLMDKTAFFLYSSDSCLFLIISVFGVIENAK